MCLLVFIKAIGDLHATFLDNSFAFLMFKWYDVFLTSILFHLSQNTRFAFFLLCFFFFLQNLFISFSTFVSKLQENLLELSLFAGLFCRSFSAVLLEVSSCVKL